MRNNRSLFFLIIAYILAVWIPGPGVWISQLNLGLSSVRVPQLTLAILLFSAGSCSSLDAMWQLGELRFRFPLAIMMSVILPLLTALGVCVLLLGVFSAPPAVALGVLIVAAMPVANSSIGWSTIVGGNIALSIGLLFVSTAFSPVLVPVVITAVTEIIGSANSELASSPWNSNMSVFFLVWVFLPALLGLLVSSFLVAAIRDRQMVIARRVSFSMLVFLNYLNGSMCLPALREDPMTLAWPVGAASGLVFASFGAARLSLRFVGSRHSSSASSTGNDYSQSLLLATVLRNTGAALVFAGVVLPSFVQVSITIISYTMFQHVFVSAVISRSGKALSLEEL